MNRVKKITSIQVASLLPPNPSGGTPTPPVSLDIEGASKGIL